MTFTKLAVLFSLSLAGAVFAQAPASDTEQQSLKKYTDLLRQDLRADKHSIIDAAMALEPANKAKFWGIYDGYEKESKALWDARLANIKKYAENYDKMTDSVADQLAATALKNDQQRNAILQKVYGQMKSALGSKSAARFLQVETVLEQLVGLQVNANLPLIQ
jgi:hypothetical protein